MPVKRLILFAALGILFLACTETDQQKAERLKTEICGKIAAKPSSEGFLSARKIFNNEIAKIDEQNRSEVVRQFLSQAEDCIKSIRFKKQVNAKSLSVSGNCESFISLDKVNSDILYNGIENPSFYMNLNFVPSGKVPEKKVINDVKCSVELFASDGSSITEVNFYPTPDLKSLLTDGKKRASISVPLFPLWKTLEKDPLGVAANSFSYAERATSFAVKINITSSDGLKPGELEKLDKQYDDMLDKLNKK